MKKVLFSLFISTAAFAGGKVQLRPQYYLMQHRPGIDGGLAIYQHLFWKLQFNSWLGAGIKPVQSGYSGWAVANVELEEKITDRWSLAEGGYFRYNPKINEQDNSVGLKVSYKIW